MDVRLTVTGTPIAINGGIKSGWRSIRSEEDTGVRVVVVKQCDGTNDGGSAIAKREKTDNIVTSEATMSDHEVIRPPSSVPRLHGDRAAHACSSSYGLTPSPAAVNRHKLTVSVTNGWTTAV
jgi:hypothetical protein